MSSARATTRKRSPVNYSQLANEGVTPQNVNVEPIVKKPKVKKEKAPAAAKEKKEPKPKKEKKPKEPKKEKAPKPKKEAKKKPAAA
jgi:hypothetical protein